MANCANYAERNGILVTSDPSRFAAIIDRASAELAGSADFDNILRGIYSNIQDALSIDRNLAHAVFELPGNIAALSKAVGLNFAEESYISPTYSAKRMESGMRLMAAGNFAEAMEWVQGNNTLVVVANMIGSAEEKELAMASRLESIGAMQRVDSRFWADAEEEYGISKEEIERRISLFHECHVYDPVEVSSLDGESQVDLERKTPPDEIKDILYSSELFKKRMQHLAPYTYAIRAAKQLLETEGGRGAGIPMSPSFAIEVCIPKPDQPSLSDGDRLRIGITSKFNEIMQILAEQADSAMESFDENGELKMTYLPFDDEDIKVGVFVLRPSIPHDRKVVDPIQFLELHHYKSSQAGIAKPEGEVYPENEQLRATIRAERKRFLGRRPVSFTMPEELRATGLDAVSLRYNPNDQSVRANFQLADGEVELTLSRDFSIHDVSDRVSILSRQSNPFYENLILKLAKEWICRPVVDTSEGEVSERTGKSANFGHYGYLRVVQGVDGEPPKAWKYSQDRYDACIEEQGEKLDEVDERRQAKDDAIDEATGIRRRTTYYSESFDPAKPPLVVHYDKSVIVS